MADTPASPVTFGGRDGEALSGHENDTHRDHLAKDETIANTKPSQGPALASLLQRFTDKTLDFLSHASNETLGACLAGLAAGTYLVLGRLGLVIIGVAGGVVLHATWEGIRSDDRDEATKKVDQDRKRETGIEVAKRLLQWRQGREKDETAEDSKVYAAQALDYSSFGAETSKALDHFTNSFIKDYVHYWYDPAIPDESTFPASSRKLFTAFVLSLLGHIRRKRPADAFLDFTTNATSITIVFLNELSSALRASPYSPVGEAVSLYLELKPDSSLSYMLDQQSQRLKLTDAAEDILQAYLDPKAYNCAPVHVFCKQVLTQLVLESTIKLCSRPEWINEWIVYGLEESVTTQEVMDIVDAGVKNSENTGLASPMRSSVQIERPVREKESSPEVKRTPEHRRTISKAEEAMDEAMQEARRLTEMMIQEDERRTREEKERQNTSSQNGVEVIEAAPQPTPPVSSTPSDSGHRIGLEPSSQQLSEKAETGTVAADQLQSKEQFTNFDQIVPSTQPTALSPEKTPKKMTLHNASISIFDDSLPGDRTSIKAKPNTDYLIQIEPESSAFPGWMISRKYHDFEALHEILRRISVITGVAFNEAHAELPKWKVHTKTSLRIELERYLADAVRFQPLAESEGAKRFLEKDQGLSQSPSGGSKSFSWSNADSSGKTNNMINVLAKAPKQVAGGGLAVLGGVAGLVGSGKTQNRSRPNLPRVNSTSSREEVTNGINSSRSSIGLAIANESRIGFTDSPRGSQDSLRAPSKTTPQRRGSGTMSDGIENKSRRSESPHRPSSVTSEEAASALGESSHTPPSENAATQPASTEALNLPPPPSEMPEDYIAPTSPVDENSLASGSKAGKRELHDANGAEEPPPTLPPRPNPAATKADAKQKAPLSEQETSVAIELMFAIISELYTLSSAWQFRRTLLSAAKAFLLRPGNPQLTNIRTLVQESLLDANLSDSSVAQHIYKMRYNALPTEQELEDWYRDYPEKTDEQKEALRIKARRLLVAKGMPPALTSVMGAAASGEALGKVFDCLQVPEVSRGLVFGLMLQALKVVTD